jgi:hypothetical protein
MKMIRARAVLALLAAALVAPASAGALSGKLTISPANPIVDDSTLTVRYTAKKPLRSGYHYEFTVVGATGRNCAKFVNKVTTQHGKRASTRLSSYDDTLDGGPEWCQGKASVTVSRTKDTDEPGGGSILAIHSFRFVAKP